MLQLLGSQIGYSSCGALLPDQWVLAQYVCTQACPSYRWCFMWMLRFKHAT